MNILFLSGYNINPFDGGIARITHTLAHQFQSNGHIVWYLGYRKVSDDDSQKQLYFPSGIPEATEENIIYLEKVIYEKNINVVIVQTNPRKSYIQMLSKCKQHHSFLLISCFHNLILTQISNYAYGMEYKLKKKRLSCVFSLLKNKWLNKLIVNLYIQKNKSQYRYIVDKSDVSVVLGNSHKEELLRMIGKEEDKSIKIIPNCIDEKNSVGAYKENEILWVGSVDCSVKRIDYMIDIWQRIYQKRPNWILRILGDGPALKEMQKRVEDNKIKNIKFEGRVIPDTYYDRAKIICVTSVHESFSLVTIEAKHHGVVPVVQDSFPMAKEIVHDGVDGLLVLPFNQKDFVDKLNYLMSNEELVKEYSQQAIEHSQNYDVQRVSSLWENVFKSNY